MVTTRRSMRTMRSTIGMSSTRPGPFAPISLPSRNTTPRYYPSRTRTADRSIVIARIATTRNTDIKGSNSSMSRLLGNGRRPDGERQPADADDFDRIADLDRRVARRGPVFTFDEHLAAAAVDAGQRRCHSSDHGAGA